MPPPMYLGVMPLPAPQSAAARLRLPVLTAYLAVFGLCIIAALVFLLLKKPFFFGILAALPIAAVIVTRPRLAVLQYVAGLFIFWPVLPSVPILLIELSALLVIAAAVLDLFLHDTRSSGLPPLTLNYLILGGAVLLAALFSHEPLLAARPMIRLAFLIVTFLALYRLNRHFRLGDIIRAYWLVAVAHGLIVVTQFVMIGGADRTFGLAWTMADELTMLALPFGAAQYFWSRRHNRWYLAGTTVLLATLVATQSRALIIFGAIALGLVIVISYVRAGQLRREATADAHVANAVRKRCGLLVIGVLAAIGLAALVAPSLFAGVLGRFERLWTLEPGGTFRLRLTLWGTALQAFADHPILGVGPGVYKGLRDLYPTLHLDPAYVWVQGLSAHNLTLHYLAETGLVGATALLALFVNHVRTARRAWLHPTPEWSTGAALGLYVTALMFLISALLEAGWMWGQTAFMAVFFFALTARVSRTSTSLT